MTRPVLFECMLFSNATPLGSASSVSFFTSTPSSATIRESRLITRHWFFFIFFSASRGSVASFETNVHLRTQETKSLARCSWRKQEKSFQNLSIRKIQMLVFCLDAIPHFHEWKVTVLFGHDALLPLSPRQHHFYHFIIWCFVLHLHENEWAEEPSSRNVTQSSSALLQERVLATQYAPRPHFTALLIIFMVSLFPPLREVHYHTNNNIRGWLCGGC